MGSFLPGVQGEGRACERPSQPLTQRAAPRALGSFGLFSEFCGEAPRVSGKRLKVAHLSPQDTAGHQAEAWSCRGPLRQPVLEVTGRPPLCPPPWGHRTTAIRTPGVALTASDTLRAPEGNLGKLPETSGRARKFLLQFILWIRCHLLGRAFSPPSHLSPPGLLPDF